MFRGVRGRVTAAVLAITAVLYSLLGAIGFIAIANAARDEARSRVEHQLDALEAALRNGTATVGARTADGIETQVAVPGRTVVEVPGVLQVERRVRVRGADVVLMGTVTDPSTATNLRSLYRMLWIGIPIAAITSALLAGLATKRALRPVDGMTALAADIGHGATGDLGVRIPVPDTDDEVERLAVTLNDMLDRIERTQRHQRQFTSDAAHELRTPLMALQGEIELAAPGLAGIDAELPVRLGTLAERLRLRIDDLVLLSMLDEAPTLHPVALSLGALLADEAAGIDAEVEVVGDGEVQADRALLARAARNLLANARRHADARVTVRVVPEATRVWIHVDDDGPGILPGDRDRIFQRFARLDEARTLDRGGAGLGLAIARSVAEAHDGGVEASTSPDGGARLSMWFPVAGA